MIIQTRRIVKKYYGVSFQKRLLQAKMEKSQFIMANTDLSLKAIAEQSGYSAYHTFYEAFTSHFGQTPSQYRETCEKNNPSPPTAHISAKNKHRAERKMLPEGMVVNVTYSIR